MTGAMDRVIAQFYEASMNPSLWRDTLHKLSQSVGAEGAVLLTFPDATGGVFNSEGLDELMQAFATGGWENTRAVRGTARSGWSVHSEASLFQPEELERLPFYSEFLGRLGFRWFAGTVLAKSHDQVVLVSLERRREQEPFSTSDVEMIERLLPHLRRATEVSLRLGSTHAQGAADALEQVNCAAVLLDGGGRVIGINRLAEVHFGRGLRLEFGQLIAEHKASNEALQRLIGDALGRTFDGRCNSEAAVAVPRPERLPLILRAVPLVGTAEDMFRLAKAVVAISDPEAKPVLGADLLRQTFGLTPAEARIATGLLAGGSIAGLSSRLGISAETVRSQLKTVFAKIGVSRQVELVALLAGMVAPGRHEDDDRDPPPANQSSGRSRG